VTVDLGDLLLRAVLGTAGLGAVVAIVRAIYVVVTERGPRKRVEAIKQAQDTLTNLPDDASLRAFVEVHRDRELAALGASMARATKRSERWQNIVSRRARLISSAAATVVSLVGAITLVSVITTIDWDKPVSPDPGADELVATLLPVAVALFVVLGTLTAEQIGRRRRKNRPSVVFSSWGIPPEAIAQALALLAESDPESDSKHRSENSPE
jgi:ABC-type multidrug transport system fused ATPase/permease subunit